MDSNPVILLGLVLCLILSTVQFDMPIIRGDGINAIILTGFFTSLVLRTRNFRYGSNVLLGLFFPFSL